MNFNPEEDLKFYANKIVDAILPKDIPGSVLATLNGDAANHEKYWSKDGFCFKEFTPIGKGSCTAFVSDATLNIDVLFQPEPKIEFLPITYVIPKNGVIFKEEDSK